MLRWLLLCSAAGMLIVSVWYRCRSLENIPGVNGDEGWYGLRAMEILHHQSFNVATPTGNVSNPMFMLPLVLLHLVFRPGIWVLRSVALASGLIALALNAWLCRRVFDRFTAVVSTLCLAVLPVNIAYSRFAWDASQSLLATLPVLYLALAALRFPAQRSRLLSAAIAAQVWAFVVHPTNVFVAPVILAAGCAGPPWEKFRREGVRGLLPRRVPYAAICRTVLLLILAALWLHTPASRQATGRFSSIDNLLDFNRMAHCAVLYPRLFTGDTIYRDIPGSESWLRWPAPGDTNRVGLDVLLFWGALAAAAWQLRPRRARGQPVPSGESVCLKGDVGHAAEIETVAADDRKDSLADGVLLISWALTLLGFLLVANAPCLWPGYERMAICLVAPTVLVVARGARRFAAASPRRCGGLLIAASLLGWVLLADYQVHYFRFIERTGGAGHLTFRTARTEPKLAALAAVLRQREPGETWIVSSQWWICCPLAYSAAGETSLHVLSTQEALTGLPPRALSEGRVWYVEFAGSKELAATATSLAQRSLSRQNFPDFSGRPVVCLLHVQREGNLARRP